MSELRIGISGWTYPPWRGGFYPDRLIQKCELDYASRQVNSIEINGTFYSLQRPPGFQHWYDATPDDFVFSVKGNRFITHIRRLEDPKIPLANFMASGVLCLGKKLGPFLWQLPPSLKYDRNRLLEFFKLLPRNTEEAGQLAHSHDQTVTGRAVLTAPENIPLRHALEVRHSSFENAEFISLLRDHDIAIVVADTASKWPLIEDVTSDFIYVRLHGDEELYVSGYTESSLDEWARKIRSWRKGTTPKKTRCISDQHPKTTKSRAVYVYFDNDVKTRAPFDAISLGKRFGLSPVPTDPAMFKVRK